MAADETDEAHPAGDSHGKSGNQGVIRRLISAYDPQGCGLIRFVRLSVSLLCCCNPGMANLVSMLTAVEEKRHKAKSDREAEGREWDELQAARTAEKAAYTNTHTHTHPYLHTSTDTHSHVHDPGYVNYPCCVNSVQCTRCIWPALRCPDLGCGSMLFIHTTKYHPTKPLHLPTISDSPPSPPRKTVTS